MRTQILLNLILTFVWVALTGGFEFANFIFGFALSFGIMWMISTKGEGRKYYHLVYKVIGFIFFFLYELVKANIQVAYDVITPTMYMKPGIVKLPLDAKTDVEITLLANIISLTPGTLSLDVSDDKKVLYIHSMYITDRQSFIDGIKLGFERRLLSILR